MTERVLITGAAGVVGTLMRPRLRKAGRTLRLLDLAPVKPDETAGDTEEIIEGSVTDPDAMEAACDGVDAVIHLGGLSREASWEDTLAVNVDGTRTLLEAAQQAGVGRVVLASSNHAAGFRRVADAGEDGLPADSSPRPDTYYGVSKAAIEALGSLYHSRFGMDVIAVRIGSCFETPLPLGLRGLTTWLSPDDGGAPLRGLPERSQPRLPAGVGRLRQHPAGLLPRGGRGARLPLRGRRRERSPTRCRTWTRRRGSRPRWSAAASAPPRSGRPTRSSADS